jgi:2,4-dienoyl-CoA reductase-like NADH-dependent reductase (Old Yellow Enzyme family)
VDYLAAHEKFAFKSLEDLTEKIQELSADIRLANDFSPLGERVRVGGLYAPNAFAIHPMEGCDSEPDGSPSELVHRRYHRFASGGAGLLWWEACAVLPEARANPRQKMLSRDNIGKFETLLKNSMEAAKAANGADHRPVNIIQLTHSGRYCRPNTHLMERIIPQHDPILGARARMDESHPLVTDAYLESLTGHYVEAARLAREAGFDGVDVKACHRYLLSELLASYNRKGKYGGSFENRTRLLFEIIAAIKAELGEDFIIACRFNVFDAHPYPYGFGCDKEDMWKYDPAEPLELVRKLCEAGAGLLSNSAGNPYYIYPQVTRPFDTSSSGVPVPDEHPLESIARLFMFTRGVQKAAGNIPVVGNGYTWLRQFIPYAGAANLADKSCSFVGLGRGAFAYPDTPRDVLHGKGMQPGKCCIACSKCTQLMRDHGKSGCVIRDAQIYAPLSKEYREIAVSTGIAP